ncbi:hypothetical protein [Rubrolithibacter danxiaensis]|uniref:hypothetical protein n=1 Tax=Rubrolithibacter danxiaensis TaxID=3390805 RepID=UPI003BF8D3F7
MHFGKIVKSVAQAQGLSAEEFAVLLGRTGKEVLDLYEQEEWGSNTIKAASSALEYDFGKYLNEGYTYNFHSSSQINQREFLLIVKYPKGKGYLLQSWLSKIMLIAKAIGLEME